MPTQLNVTLAQTNLNQVMTLTMEILGKLHQQRPASMQHQPNPTMVNRAGAEAGTTEVGAKLGVEVGARMCPLHHHPGLQPSTLMSISVMGNVGRSATHRLTSHGLRPSLATFSLSSSNSSRGRGQEAKRARKPNLLHF